MTNFNNLGWNDEFSGATRLPFQALTLRALRGDSKLKGVKPDARYFGGWAYNADDARKLVNDGDLRVDPAWTVYEAEGEKGPYTEAAHRVAHVAVIKGRMRWVNDMNREFNTKYFPGSRMHIQYLVGLFKLNQGVPEFAGMAMLTAKGHQASNLQKAIDEYSGFIRLANSADAALARLPRPAWIMTLGTQGDKPIFETVGKGNATSTITPIKAVLPKDAAEMTKRRVADDALEFMAQKFDAAQQWLGAWKSAGQEPLPIAQSATPVAESDDFEEKPF